VPEVPEQHDRTLFDESGYLRLYQDVADAVAAGRMASAWVHYDRHGRAEGRRSNDVDADFYLRAYPQIADDLGRQPVPADAAAHYLTLGRERGYLPNRRAPRAAPGSGPWTDGPDAPTLIRERRALGTLSHRKSVLLRNWVADGYVVIDTLERDILAAAALDLERAFAGAWPGLLFDCPALAAQPVPWHAVLPPHAAHVLDPHYLSKPIRDLLLSEPITGFLGALFDAPVLLACSRACLRDAGIEDHRESDTARFTRADLLATVWIGLEGAMENAATAERAGGIHVHAGSHHPKQAGAPRAFPSDTGAAIVIHRDLLHGAPPVDEGGTRRGVTAWFCPRPVAPLYAEQRPMRLYPSGAHRFATGFYPGLEPPD
jgi:hypothetical protein